MFGNGSNFGMNGDNFSPVFIMAYNRTGATVLKGQTAMSDILNVQAETSGSAPYTGNPNGAYYNLGPVVQAADTEGQPVYVLDDISCADNALGRWVKCGECQVAIVDTDVATTATVKGGRISLLVSKAASPGGGALTTGGGNVCGWVTGGARTAGIALSAGIADSTTAANTVDASAHLVWCIWIAGVPLLGSTDT